MLSEQQERLDAVISSLARLEEESVASDEDAPNGINLLLDLMQAAKGGSMELDARIDCVLTRRDFAGMASAGGYFWQSAGFERHEAKSPACWSEDLTASLQLVPEGHNFSIGRRDGVYWAWIQPNDNWFPTPDRYRHDHPQGSGLVVAYTMPLALLTAAVILRELLGTGPWLGHCNLPCTVDQCIRYAPTRVSSHVASDEKNR